MPPIGPQSGYVMALSILMSTVMAFVSSLSELLVSISRLCMYFVIVLCM